MILAQGSVLIQQSDLYHWTTIDLGATAASSLLGVRFSSDGAGTDGYVGPTIDNVSLGIVPAVSSVPEPSSICLTGMTATLALGSRLRNRKGGRPRR